MVAMPANLNWARTAAITPDGTFWIGGREGAFSSQDNGQTWQPMSTLPISDISGLRYDADLKRLMITSKISNWVLGMDPSTKTWKWWDAGWTLRQVHSADGHLIGATLFNGIVVQNDAKTTASAAGQ
jgi:hypothetical protein